MKLLVKEKLNKNQTAPVKKLDNLSYVASTMSMDQKTKEEIKLVKQMEVILTSH